MKRYVCIVLVLGCAHCIPNPSHLPEPAPVTDWADQLGAVLPQAVECVQAHPGDAAVVVGVRILGTGEFGIMTRGPSMEVVGCVHDGDQVVHQAAVSMHPREVGVLPFVTLGPAKPAPQGDCAHVQPILWGSSFVGWLTKRTCAPGKMNQPLGTPATSVPFRREQDEYLDAP